MKNLLTILALVLCSCSAFGQGAQYRPTPFANGFVQTVNSQGQAQTYFGLPSQTNLALLSGTNVFTGTNTFTAAKFFPSNGIGLRFLAVTNLPVLTFYNAATNASVPYTNGGFSVCTPVASISVPACVGSNSAIGVSFVYYKTNATSSASELHAWAGTNYISRLASITASATVQRFIFGGGAFNSAGNLFKNFGSFTNQIPATRDGNDTGVDAPFTIVDSGSPWTLNIGFTSTSGATNVAFVRFEVFEFVMP